MVNIKKEEAKEVPKEVAKAVPEAKAVPPVEAKKVPEIIKPKAETADGCEGKDLYKKMPPADPTKPFILELHPGSSSTAGMRLEVPKELLGYELKHNEPTLNKEKAWTFDQLIRFAVGNDRDHPIATPRKYQMINDALKIEIEGQGRDARPEFGKYGIAVLATLAQPKAGEKFCVVETIHYDMKKTKDAKKDVLTEPAAPYFKKRSIKSNDGTEKMFNMLELTVASNLAGGLESAAEPIAVREEPIAVKGRAYRK